MSSTKNIIILAFAGILTGLSMQASAETVFEEIRVVYDGGGLDHVSSAAVDVYGNMYITGARGNNTGIGANTYYTAKYDSYGREEWLRIYSPGFASGVNKMTVDRDGNAYVALGGHLGRILKYDADGNESVLANPNIVPFGCCSNQVGLILDEDENNLYSWASHTIQKINLNNGSTEWIQRLHTANYLVRDIAVDSSGNIYVVGHSKNNLTDIVIKKFDSLGNVVWSQFWSEPGVQTELAYGLELDSANNVYILAQVLSYEASCLYCLTSSVISFSADGNFLNSASLNGGVDYLAGNIKVADDKIYVVMREKSGTTMITQKRNLDLSLAWSATHPIDQITPNNLDIDGVGNVVVGFRGNDGKMSTIKFDMNGNELWTIKGEGSSSAFVKFGVASDVYTAGSSYLDAYMYRYDVTQLICQ